jgi:methyl-accepting chemotaxis protein
MGKASVEKLNDIIRQFYDVDYPLISGLQKLKGYMDEANEIAVRYVAARNAKRLPEIQQDFEAKLKASSSLIERLQQRKASTEIEEGLTQVGKVLDGMKDAVLGDAGVFALHTEAQKAAQAAANSRSTMIEAAKACEAAIGEVHKKLSQAVETAKTNSIQVAATARRWELFILGMGFLASIVLALLLAKSMSSPIKVLARQIARISQGDPTAEVSDLKRRDELGTLAKGFRALLETLRGDQTRRLLDTVNIVSRSAAEISATVAQLTANTSRVSAAVAETSATVEEVKQAAQLASEKAKKVAESAQQAVQTSESGKKASEETIARINLIKEQMQSIGETVVRLSDHSQTVAEIMDVVQDIAEQSNLLAVNASIEAARAGDYGKGFGVVAQEIKSLADQSRNATLQVRSILGDTQKWISAVVMATEQGGKAVDAGVAQSVVSAESLLALAQSLVGSDQAAQIIYGSAQQQFAGVKQISTAMESISEAMKQDVAGVEQLQSAVHRLQDLGEELNRLAERLRV